MREFNFIAHKMKKCKTLNDVVSMLVMNNDIIDMRTIIEQMIERYYIENPEHRGKYNLRLEINDSM